MQFNSEVDRPYSIDTICPVGKGLRMTLKNYSKAESQAIIRKLKKDRSKLHINLLIEMAFHDYVVYPSDRVEEIQEGPWFGDN